MGGINLNPWIYLPEAPLDFLRGLIGKTIRVKCISGYHYVGILLNVHQIPDRIQIELSPVFICIEPNAVLEDYFVNAVLNTVSIVSIQVLL